MELWLLVAGVAYVFWFCARWARETYKRKGRRPGEGYLLGLLLGPVGVLIAVLTPRVDMRHKMRCLRCREWVDQDADKCPHCDLSLKITSMRVSKTHQSSPDWPAKVGSSLR